MPLIPCRVTTNVVGARAGEERLVDPEDPKVALWLEKGLLAPTGEAVESDDVVAEIGGETGGKGDADKGIGASAEVGHDTGAELETVGDGVAESSLPSA